MGGCLRDPPSRESLIWQFERHHPALQISEPKADWTEEDWSLWAWKMAALEAWEEAREKFADNRRFWG